MNNALAVQGVLRNGLRLSQRRGAVMEDYTPFGDSRPSFDYVRRGDVIRVSFEWSNALPANATSERDFRSALEKSFSVVNFLPSRDWTFGGRIVVDIQPRSDYSRLTDVTSVVLHDASAYFNVNNLTARAEFVSKVEDTGGTVTGGIQLPATGEGGGANALSDFFTNLTASPVTLAVVIGGAVLLLAAMKK